MDDGNGHSSSQIGGSVGDIVSLPFLERSASSRKRVGRENCLFIHLTLVPYLKAAAELKTKPTLHSVAFAPTDWDPARYADLPVVSKAFFGMNKKRLLCSAMFDRGRY